MTNDEQERLQQLLRRAMPPVHDAEPARDLWPAMQRRLAAEPAPPPWFDWALAGAVIAFLAFAPSTIPMLLYYL